MEFDRYTIALLRSTKDRRPLGDDEAARLQDEHLAYLASLHEAGKLLAAGPMEGGPDPSLRGLSVFRLPPEEAQRLGGEDPLVRAGQLSYECFPWMVPGGAVTFSKVRFPHAMSEV